MHMHRIGAKAHKACGVWALIAGLGLGTGMETALAQAQPAAAASDAPSEAVRRQALSPYRFILQNANAPTRAAKPAVAVAPEPKRPPAPAAIEQAAVQPRSAPAAAASPSPAPATLAPSAPEPVAALTPRPAEPVTARSVNREVIPVRTDEPRLTPAQLHDRVTGEVRVQFDLNPDGSTGNIKIVSSTNRTLNRNTIEAVSGWKFQPVDEVVTVETKIVYAVE